jgi:hypothetical protein
VRFTHIGKPYLTYTQRAWATSDGRRLHGETGFLRLPEGLTHAELVLAHPNGQVEIDEGVLVGQRLELATTLVAHTSTAKQVDALTRVMEVTGDHLVYTVAMAAVGEPLTHHLDATLQRVRDPVTPPAYPQDT